MQDIVENINQLLKQTIRIKTKLNLDKSKEEAIKLEKKLHNPSIWKNSIKASKISKQLSDIQKRLNLWDSIKSELDDLIQLAKMSDNKIQKEIGSSYLQLKNRIDKLKIEIKLSGKYDKYSAILSIYAGTGGTDAQDWTEMLMRMYLRYCNHHSFKTNVLDLSKGEEAGVKSITIEINGQDAYGMLKSENGVHRLIRQSPFNANHLRQTSFALVEVLPAMEDLTEVVINAKDIKIDVFKSSGHGGQSVNTTDSAVRVTHIPTGLVATCQDEKSQLKNKLKALKVLKARLLALMIQQHKSSILELKAVNPKAEWGSQIRSYTLHPYTLVKDHRTNFETTNVNDVLSGNIEPFIEAYLLHNTKNNL